MKKFLCFCTFLALLGVSAEATAIYGHFEEFEQEEVEEIKPLVIPKGSFFRGFLGQTVSSEFNKSGDIVKVLITSDFILNDEIILPQNSVFIGMVDGLQPAEQGRDGFFAINIIGLNLPDGTQHFAKGYVVSGKNGRVFGGAFSKRSGYKTTVHRSGFMGKRGTLHLQQNGPRIMGDETKINMGQLVTIVLEEPIQIR